MFVLPEVLGVSLGFGGFVPLGRLPLSASELGLGCGFFGSSPSAEEVTGTGSLARLRCVA